MRQCVSLDTHYDIVELGQAQEASLIARMVGSKKAAERKQGKGGDSSAYDFTADIMPELRPLVKQLAPHPPKAKDALLKLLKVCLQLQTRRNHALAVHACLPAHALALSSSTRLSEGGGLGGDSVCRRPLVEGRPPTH